MSEAQDQTNTDEGKSELSGTSRLTADELLEIEAKEHRQNKAFRAWISNNNCFFNFPQSKQEDLALYVEALNKEIADKEALIMLLQKRLLTE